MSQFNALGAFGQGVQIGDTLMGIRARQRQLELADQAQQWAQQHAAYQLAEQQRQFDGSLAARQQEHQDTLGLRTRGLDMQGAQWNDQLGLQRQANERAHQQALMHAQLFDQQRANEAAAQRFFTAQYEQRRQRQMGGVTPNPSLGYGDLLGLPEVPPPPQGVALASTPDQNTITGQLAMHRRASDAGVAQEMAAFRAMNPSMQQHVLEHLEAMDRLQGASARKISDAMEGRAKLAGIVGQDQADAYFASEVGINPQFIMNLKAYNDPLVQAQTSQRMVENAVKNDPDVLDAEAEVERLDRLIERQDKLTGGDPTDKRTQQLEARYEQARQALRRARLSVEAKARGQLPAPATGSPISRARAASAGTSTGAAARPGPELGAQPPLVAREPAETPDTGQFGHVGADPNGGARFRLASGQVVSVEPAEYLGYVQTANTLLAAKGLRPGMPGFDDVANEAVVKLIEQGQKKKAQKKQADADADAERKLWERRNQPIPPDKSRMPPWWMHTLG